MLVHIYILCEFKYAHQMSSSEYYSERNGMLIFIRIQLFSSVHISKTERHTNWYLFVKVTCFLPFVSKNKFTNSFAWGIHYVHVTRSIVLLYVSRTGINPGYRDVVEPRTLLVSLIHFGPVGSSVLAHSIFIICNWNSSPTTTTSILWSRNSSPQ